MPAEQQDLWPDEAKELDDEVEAQHTYRRTPYEAVAPLLHALPLPQSVIQGHWADPCAGAGDLLAHVHRFYGPWGPQNYTAVEVRDECAALYELGERLPLDVLSPYDFFGFGEDSSVDVAITNLPWYELAIPIVEQMFRSFPHAYVIGHCCTRLPLDGGRPVFFRRHHPDVWLCNGRQTYPPATSAYPQPVAWYVWAPWARDRDYGVSRVLPRYDEIKELCP